MRFLLVYDVSDERRPRRVAWVSEDYGQRVQRSVFEQLLQPGQLPALQARLRELVSLGEDKVRYDRLCGADASDIAVDGQGQLTEPHRDTLVWPGETSQVVDFHEKRGKMTSSRELVIANNKKNVCHFPRCHTTMNPHIESTFHTETDLYCGADTDCAHEKPLWELVLTEADLLSIFQDHARRSVYLREGMISALKELNAEAAKIWVAHLSPALGKPATVPVGLAVADARTLHQAASALYTPPPVHLRLKPSDAQIIRRIWQRLGGFATRFRIGTTPKGVTYISLSGYAGLRSGALVGTRFLANNPTILRLGIGVQGIKHIARSSASLAIVVSTGIELGDWYFRDDATLGDLIGGVGMEVVKAGVLIALGVGAGILVTKVTAIAILPAVGFVAVSFLAGWKLNEADVENGWKKDLQKWFNSLPSNLDGLEPGWYRMDQGALERLHGVKAEYEAAIQRLKKETTQKAAEVATQAAAAAIAVALKAIERKALQELQQLLGPRLR